MKNEIYQRKATIKPNTADDESRSIQAVIASDRPVRVYRGGRAIDEILPLSGVELPERVSLIDSHKRDSIDSILGSAREFEKTDDGFIISRNYYSNTEFGRMAYALYRDGHAIYFSVGYRVDEYDQDLLKDGSEKTIDGRTIKGPVAYANRWSIVEVSAAVIGADENAKARSKQNEKGESEMKEENEVKITPEEKTRAEQVAESPPVIERKDDVDLDWERRAAVDAERKRIASIGQLCRKFDVDPDEFIRSGAEIADVQAQILKQIEKDQENHRASTVQVDESEKLQRAAVDALLFRGAMPLDEGVSMQGNPFHGMTLMELGKDCLRREGVNYAGLDASEIAGRVMTSSDFSNIINTTAYKSMKIGFAEKRYLWGRFCSVGSAPNFLAQTEVEISRGGTLSKLTTENPEYPMKYFTDGGQTYSLDTYAGMWAFSRKAIINDSMNIIANMRRMGATAARTIEKTVFAFIESNPTLDDGFDLFSTDHSNLATGADIDPPSLDTFNAAELAMSEQLDIDGETRLDITPVYFLAPKALKGNTSQFLSSPWWNDEVAMGTPDYSTATTRANIWNNVLEEIYTSHLTDSTAWYFLGEKGDHFEVFFLNGRQTPIMESAIDFNTKDQKYTVSLDFGVRAKDYRAVYKNAGT